MAKCKIQDASILLRFSYFSLTHSFGKRTLLTKRVMFWHKGLKTYNFAKLAFIFTQKHRYPTELYPNLGLLTLSQTGPGFYVFAVQVF